MDLKPEFKFSHTYIYLISAPVLLSVYYYHSTASQFLHVFPSFTNHDKLSIYEQYWKFVVFFILMGLIPLLYLVLAVKKPLSDFGIQAGNYKLGLKLVFILVPFVIADLDCISNARYPE
jgi:hypothetical protein